MDLHLPALAFIAFLLLQRVAELILARRNTRRLLARGRSRTAPRITR